LAAQGGIKMGIPDKLINVEKMQATKDVEVSIRALKDEYGHVRSGAANALWKIRGKREVEPPL